MEGKMLEGKRSLKEKATTLGDQEDVDDDNMEEEDNCLGSGDDEKKKGFVPGGGGVYGKRGSTSSSCGAGGGLSRPSCQVEKCGADLSDAKRYHRRHKVCEVHAKAPAVVVAGLRQRFCQQCSRFHELTEFDETKRSCRRRLAGHNERRRKSSAADSCGEGSSHKGVVDAGTNQVKDSQFRQTEERGSSGFQVTLPGNPTYKRTQFR